MKIYPDNPHEIIDPDEEWTEEEAQLAKEVRWEQILDDREAERAAGI